MAGNDKHSWPGWEIEKCIGKGGFGAVYEIKREVFGDEERCALKIITIPKDPGEIEYMRCEGMDDDSITNTYYLQVGDIVKEYKLMSLMRDNPNIVHCDDFRYTKHEDDLGWDIYIKMELLTPLMKVLDRMKTEQEVIRLGIEICNALAACQKHNIIHRDIKPQNIFISPEGHFKLGDFGIARTMEHTTKATAGIGTYSFMAPEVALGNTYGATVDLYSLGLVLYWLLNERRGPFVPLPPVMPTMAANDMARIRRYSGEMIPAPKNGNEGLKAVILKACAFNVKDRFQTAQEMLDALKGLQESAKKDPKSEDKGIHQKIDIAKPDDYEEDATVLKVVNNEIRKENVSVAANSHSDCDNLDDPNDATVYAKDAEKNHEDARDEKTVGVVFSSSNSEEQKAKPNLKTEDEKTFGLDRERIGFAKDHQHVSEERVIESVNTKDKETKKKPIWIVAAILAVVAALGSIALIGGGRDGSGTVIETESPEVHISSTEMPQDIHTEPTDEAADVDPGTAGKPMFTLMVDTPDWEEYITEDGITVEDHSVSPLVFGSKYQRQQISTITFLSTIKDAAEGSWDVSQNQDGTVLAWVKPNGDLYDLFIGAEGGVLAPEDCSQMFSEYATLYRIDFNGAFDTTNVTTMNSMFDGNYGLTELDLSGFDTANVTDMSYMFDYCYNLRNLDVSGFDTAKVAWMYGVFRGCSSLTELDVSNFDTSNVVAMVELFGYCSNLTELDVSEFDTAKVNNMASMFQGCSSLTKLDLSGFDTSNVTNMPFMFKDCPNLTELDVSHFDVSKVENYKNFMDPGKTINGRPWEEFFQ